MKCNNIHIGIIFILFSFGTNAQTDTLNLFYNIGVYKLNKPNNNKIISKLNTLNPTSSYQVEIISSCDYLGSHLDNLELSNKRALEIKKAILSTKNKSVTSVNYKGVGELSTTIESKNGVAKHRKTMLVFKQKNIGLNVDLKNIASDLENIIDSKKGDVFILQNIIFKPGRHYLKKESLPTLKKLSKIMIENPNLEIELSGHICCGKNKSDIYDGMDIDTKTRNLSENRAKHIYKYLLLKKIDKSRISYKGYGFENPLHFPENSKADQDKNRRVEIKIINN
jgi:outer membrane protein OmpA-like peptidoglycan-associated protein